jgi:hypothetical protein
MAFSLFALMPHAVQVKVLFSFLLLGANDTVDASAARSELFRLVIAVASALAFGWACTHELL